MSAAGETDEGHASTGVRSASTQPAVRPASAVSSSLNSRPAQPGPEPMWDSLIELKQTEPSEHSATALAGSPRPPRWLWPLISVGSLLLGFLIAWAVIIRVKTKDGEIVVRNVPEQTEASVDGERLKLKLPGKSDLVEVKPAPDGKGVQVKNGETEATGEEVSIESGGDRPVIAQLELNVATSQNDGHEGRWRRLFNGKDKSGWTENRNNQGTWKIDDGVLVGSGGGIRGQPALLVTVRQDFSNFRLRVKSRFRKDQGGRIVIRHSDANDTRNGYSLTPCGLPIS
jgi:hypothetical protein